LRDDGSLEYTPGQYGAVEYRRAACAVLADALWTYWQDQPSTYMRQVARHELGRGVARRWIN